MRPSAEPPAGWVLVACPPDGLPPDVRPGTLVLFDGALTRSEERRRHVVRARRLVPLFDVPASEPRRYPTGMHAAPVPHERAGHFRLVGVGTPRERLVWVRPTTVGIPTR